MRLLLVAVFILVTGVLPAQMRFSHLDQKQGLSQNTATAFLQDREGFIWIGTQDGLNRYDGYTFQVFRRVANDTNSLCDNFILSLAEDTDGNIWAGTRNGLCVYSKRTNRFYRYYSSAEERKEFHASVRKMQALSGGGVVYRTLPGELIAVQFSLASPAPVFKSEVLYTKVATFSYCSETNELAFLQQGSVRIINPGSTVIHRSYLQQPVGKSVSVLLLTKDLLYIADSAQLQVIQVHVDDSSRHTFLCDAHIEIMDVDHLGKLWIGTRHGLRILSEPLDVLSPFLQVHEDRNDFFSLLGERVEAIYHSPLNLVWIGTVGGVSIYDPMQTRFQHLRGQLDEAESKEPVWFTMSFADITLWATDDHITYTCGPRPVPEWLALIPADLRYTAGVFDTDSRLWLGTREAGLICIDTLKKTIDKRLLRHPAFSGSVVMDLRCDTRGRVWVASIGSLQIVDPVDFSVKTISGRTRQYEIRTNYFTALQPDENGMYVGSAGGLFYFDASDTSYTLYTNDPSSSGSLAYNIINDIEMIEGYLWIGTMGSGLDRFDPQTKKFAHYTTAEGLPNNTIYGIEPGSQHELWMSTNEGIVVLNTLTGSSRNYTMRDGLPSNEFVINKHGRNSIGTLVFASAAGLVMFDPRQFTSSASSVQPVLTKLQVNYVDRTWDSDSLLLLQPDERNIFFEFSAIDFRNQDKITYAYRLTGFDTAWHMTGAFNRTVNFTNLPYGEYLFEVRYKVAGEPWSENVLRRAFVIATPFYATTWFLVLVIVCGITLTVLTVRYIAQRKLRKQLEALKVQEQIRNEKERISRDLHDNVGAQLTYVISSIDNLSYSLNRQNTAQKESKKLDQLGEFTRGTIDQLRESIWAINSEKISLSELCGRWKQQLALLQESRPEFSGKVLREGPDEILKPGVAIEVHRIVQEAITNAFKHSEGQSVELNTCVIDDVLRITVRDNGKGVNNVTDKPGHYGLSNMRERAKKANALLTIRSENGTEVILEIPRK